MCLRGSPFSCFCAPLFADAYRKEQRKREVQRNKKEREFTRAAVSQRDNPDEIKKQLKAIIQLEDENDG